MPSFRITQSIGLLAPGVAPDDVLPAVVAAAREVTNVEASNVEVVAGRAQLVVRFTADDASAALAIAKRVVEDTSAVAETVSAVVTERVKGRWLTRR